ncbi:MAG: gephyrin-like molybdotransferase Glp [Candidatus Binatia bacterium]
MPKAVNRSRRRAVALTPTLSRRARAKKRTHAAATAVGIRSFFRVVTTDEARARIAAAAPVATETIRVAAALGRVIATDLVAAVDLPHFDRANMDGYAVRAPDTFGASASIPAYLALAGSVDMGKEATRRLHKGEAMRIATGGMLPPGADAVVMIEYTEEVGHDTATGRTATDRTATGRTATGRTVEVHRGVAPWENVLRIGEDIAQGAPIFGRGRRLRARDLGALTGVGLTRVAVFRRPRVALISTGDEIVAPDVRPRPGQVRNINAYSLVAMATEAGATVTDFGVIRDRREDLRRALARGLARHDVVLISGGSSVGAKDITLDVISSFPRSEIIFHGISVAPGKPTILARALDKPVLGLPGHPQSALIIFDLFGTPLLRILGGEDAAAAFAPARTVRARLSQNIASQAGREDYVRVTLAERGGERIATPLAGKSGAIFNLVKADGLVRIPASAEGIDEGAEVEVILL